MIYRIAHTHRQTNKIAYIFCTLRLVAVVSISKKTASMIFHLMAIFYIKYIHFDISFFQAILRMLLWYIFSFYVFHLNLKREKRELLAVAFFSVSKKFIVVIVVVDAQHLNVRNNRSRCEFLAHQKRSKSCANEN